VHKVGNKIESQNYFHRWISKYFRGSF